MTKRLLSLALSLVMILGLFAGLAGSASADGEIGNLFNRYLTGEKIDELFDGDVVKHGYVGKNNPGNVQYDIYRVDPEKVKNLQADTSVLEQNALYERLRDAYPDFNLDGNQLLTDLNFNLKEGEEYYAIKFFGYGDMLMQDFAKKSDLPWSGTVRLNDGSEVQNMDDKIIALYVEGESKSNPSHTGVANIGEKAFFGMDGLMLAYLGETVTTIGAKAFETCDQLSAINFPSNLESIGRRAFYACDYLVFARMNSCTKLTKIEDRTFCTCSHLTEIAFPPNVTEIGDFAFAWDHVLGTNKFNLPPKLKTIGRGAFAFCSHLGVVGDISIPASTTVIGPFAFACCFDMGRGGTLKFYPGSTGAEQALTIGMGAFAGCANLADLVFPNRVAFIESYAFSACDKLERVSFGDRDGTDTLHIRNIGDRAFDSLEDTGLSALAAVAIAYQEVDSGDDAYVAGSSSVAEQLSGEIYTISRVTPLQYAAFGGYPAAVVVESKDDLHSFPRDVTIWYPSSEYNPAAFSEWRSVIKAGNPMSTWKGYNCEPEWVGHFHEYGEPRIVERTCTQDGLEIYTCQKYQDGKPCGHVKTVVTEEHTGHKGTVVKQIDADCDEPGLLYYHCSNEWCSQKNYTEVIPALGHSFADPDDYKEATCTEAGYAKGKCVRCGKQVDEVYPALGHDTSFMELVQPPTCEEEGYYIGYCYRCESSDPVKQTVPALGHEWDEGLIVLDATINREGLKVYTCLRDGCGKTREEVIPKLQPPHVHSYVATVTKEATCKENGEIRYECSCGLYYTEQTSKTAHTWDKGVVDVKPTATEKGRMKYTCTVCRTVRYEDIPATGVAFVDVPENEWYADAVNWAVSHKPKQITTGKDSTHFAPYDDCTRGQAVTFLWRAAGEPEVSGIVNRFVDVHGSDYFYKAVLWAVKNGITTGTDNTHFSPEEACTRGHIVTFLHRWKGNPTPTSIRIPFPDVAPGKWYAVPVLWAAETGVTTGMDDGTFAPDNYCNRAQIVTFLQRAEKLP